MKNTDPLMGAKFKSSTHLLARGPCTSHKNCNIKYRIQVTATAKHMYIKLPMYLFFIWHLIVMGENPLLGPSEGVGPENLDFFWGPKWHLLCSLPFQGPKKTQFLGLNPSNGPQNGFDLIKIITSCAI